MRRRGAIVAGLEVVGDLGPEGGRAFGEDRAALRDFGAALGEVAFGNRGEVVEVVEIDFGAVGP